MKNPNKKVLLNEKNKNEKSKINSTKISDILNKLYNEEHKDDNNNKNNQRNTIAISNEQFTEQIMKEINNGEFNEICALFDEQENEEKESKSKRGSHSRNPTESFDYFRFSKINNKNLKEFQIDDRKTVVVSDKLQVYNNGVDDSDSEDEKEDENCLGYIMGNNLEKFNEENNGILFNEKSNQLIEELKNENDDKYVKTGTKIDFVEEIEGKYFNSKKKYNDFEKYISKIDNDQEKSNIHDTLIHRTIIN